MKTEQIEHSETSVHKIQTPGNRPKERINDYMDVYKRTFSHLTPCSRAFLEKLSCFTESGNNTHFTWCVQVLRSPKEAFAAAMQSWRECCEKCVCLQGDYVEK